MAITHISTKPIVTAAQIKAAWSKDKPLTTEKVEDTKLKKVAHEANRALLQAAVDKADLEAENARMVKEVEKLNQRLEKQQSSTASIRAHLDAMLAKHNIRAAFEPLIEMATERYPDDFKVEVLRGEFKCDVDQRIKIWTEVLSYQLPKLKAMEVSGQIDNQLTVIVKRFGQGANTSVDESAAMKNVTDVPATVETEQEAINRKALESVSNIPGIVQKRF